MKKELTNEEIDVILLLAENDMNVSAVARDLFISNSAVLWMLTKICVKTKLDPRCFYDLVELVKIAKERKGETDDG